MGNDDDEPRKESASKRDWFTKPTRPQEPTDPDWNIGKTPKKGQTQSWLMTLVASSSTDKSLHSFDELMSTLIDFSAYIMNGLNILNLTQETLLGPAFRLFKAKCIPALTRVNVMKKHMYGYLRVIKVQRADNVLYTFKEGDFPRHRLNYIEDMLILVAQNRLTNLSGDDVADFAIALKMLMCSDELYKFSDGTLTRLLTSLEDITKNIHMWYLPKRRWSSLGNKRAHFMIKEINKLSMERRMMRSLEKFVGGRLYDSDPRLFQRTI
uniref:Uncharacterized protein n=1 Tax=Tanacetum cinerariifolium TaxID=118510 RepID=A0A699IE63_TANCI|nr:hypothetical protein [Tanacetum cinerariifolium]